MRFNGVNAVIARVAVKESARHQSQHKRSVELAFIPLKVVGRAEQMLKGKCMIFM